MKQLKTKKLLQIDISIQVSILILTFFAIVTTELGYAFILFYFVLGGYQLLSFTLHYLLRKKRKGKTGNLLADDTSTSVIELGSQQYVG